LSSESSTSTSTSSSTLSSTLSPSSSLFNVTLTRIDARLEWQQVGRLFCAKLPRVFRDSAPSINSVSDIVRIVLGLTTRELGCRNVLTWDEQTTKTTSSTLTLTTTGSVSEDRAASPQERDINLKRQQRMIHNLGRQVRATRMHKIVSDYVNVNVNVYGDGSNGQNIDIDVDLATVLVLSLPDEALGTLGNDVKREMMELRAFAHCGAGYTSGCGGGGEVSANSTSPSGRQCTNVEFDILNREVMRLRRVFSDITESFCACKRAREEMVSGKEWDCSYS
jgi:hypothetical protein